MHLEIRGLSKSYGFAWALRDVKLELRAGECVALLGPNGAGKTTLLKLLATLLRPTTGSVELDGKRLDPSAPASRSPIGLLSPNDHLYEKLTAEENLRLFLSLYGKEPDGSEIIKTLGAVGLSARSGEYVASLSSGMKCRLSIAKWLLLEPKLLLLDEPYGALDGSGVDLLEDYVKKLCRNGGIVVVATHHVPRILTLCTRAVILRQGRVIFDEPRQQSWESLQRAYAEFLPRGERWDS